MALVQETKKSCASSIGLSSRCTLTSADCLEGWRGVHQCRQERVSGESRMAVIISTTHAPPSSIHLLVLVGQSRHLGREQTGVCVPMWCHVGTETCLAQAAAAAAAWPGQGRCTERVWSAKGKATRANTAAVEQWQLAPCHARADQSRAQTSRGKDHDSRSGQSSTTRDASNEIKQMQQLPSLVDADARWLTLQIPLEIHQLHRACDSVHMYSPE